MVLKNNKSLGQHWLKNPEFLTEIAELTTINSERCHCIEIGPGLGTLTSRLLRVFPSVTSIEFDERLARNLPKSFPGKELTVINMDILQYPEEISQEKFLTFINGIEKQQKPLSLMELGEYVIAGNIPYYITSPIIRKFLLAKNQPKRMVLLIQKEVADRIAATAGEHSQLSVFVQNYAEVELGSTVLAKEFTPPPKVDSEIIAIIPRKKPVISEYAMNLAKLGFSSPRKKLATNLAVATHDRDFWQQRLESIGQNPDCRAQDLELEEWQKLAES